MNWHAWGWPQWVYLALLAWGLWKGITRAGATETRPDAGFAIAGGGFAFWLLWMGGFFGHS